MVLVTLIKVDGFGPLTESDATGGAKLFGPTRELFYVIKVRFRRKLPKARGLARRPSHPYIFLYIPMMWGGPWGPLH